MKMRKRSAFRFVIIIIAALWLNGCAPSGAAHSTTLIDGSPTVPLVTPSLSPTATVTPTGPPLVPPSTQTTAKVSPTIPCPVPTQELFWVEKPTSPTDQLSQVVIVHIGNGEKVTVIAESGTFTSGGDSSTFSGRVEITLIPNTVHHLEVIAQVRKIVDSNGCTYGGYTLRTTRDRSGAPLVIVQGRPLPRVASAPITSANADHLQELGSIAPDTRLTTDFVFRNENELISVGYAGGISLWSAGTGQKLGTVGGGRPEALVVAANADGSLLATGGTANDPAVRLWNIQTGQMQELGRHATYLTSLAFNPSGKRLASGANDDTVRVWDVDSGQLISTFKGDVPKRVQLFNSLFWKDDNILVAAGTDAIYWWDVTSGQVVRRLAKPSEAAFMIDAAFGKEAGWLAAVAQGDAVYYWDQQTNEWSAWRVTPGSTLTQVAVSPDGKILAAGILAGGTSDSEMLIWNIATHKLLASYSIRGSVIAAIRFSPDGRYIAVGGWDAPIWLWGIP
jgi:WD40 repeat protein